MKKAGAPKEPTARELHTAAEKSYPATPLLDLIHITRLRFAIKIISEKKIETRFCDKFSAQRVYCFWGRPAYRLKDGEKASEHMALFPTIFVLRTNNNITPCSVFPFDTGAALNGLFDNGDFSAVIEDYELDPSIDGASRHVTWAFGSNRQYFEGELKDFRQSYDNSFFDIHGFEYIARMASTARPGPDSRSSTIEIAFNRDIFLSGTLELVILPDEYLNGTAPHVQKTVNIVRTLGARVEPYIWRPNYAPNNFMIQIEEIVRRDFEERGLMT